MTFLVALVSEVRGQGPGCFYKALTVRERVFDALNRARGIHGHPLLAQSVCKLLQLSVMLDVWKEKAPQEHAFQGQGVIVSGLGHGHEQIVSFPPQRLDREPLFDAFFGCGRFLRWPNLVDGFEKGRQPRR